MIDRIKAWWNDLEEKEEKIKLNHVFKEEKEPSKRKLKKRINTLEMENETLKNTIKEETYKAFMNKLNEVETDQRLRKENTRLRKQVKTLKEIIKEGKEK